MTGTIFPQTDDSLNESNLSKAYAAIATSGYVASGCTFNLDEQANTLDIGSGIAYLKKSGEARFVYPDADTITLPVTSGQNYIYLAADTSDTTSSAVNFVAQSTDAPPSASLTLKIGTADTSADTVNDDINRGSPGGGSGGSVNISEDGSTIVSDATDLNFGTNITATDDGDQTVTIDVSSGSSSGSVDVSDDGSLVVGDSTDINFGNNISASDDGDQTVTIGVTTPSSSGANEVNVVDLGATRKDDGGGDSRPTWASGDTSLNSVIQSEIDAAAKGDWLNFFVPDGAYLLDGAIIGDKLGGLRIHAPTQARCYLEVADVFSGPIRCFKATGPDASNTVHYAELGNLAVNIEGTDDAGYDIDAGIWEIRADSFWIHDCELIGRRHRWQDYDNGPNGTPDTSNNNDKVGPRETALSDVTVDTGYGKVERCRLPDGGTWEGSTSSDQVGHAIPFSTTPTSNVGHIEYEGCYVNDFIDNGFYVKTSTGRATIRNCVAKNCTNSCMRLGPGDEIIGGRVIVDMANTQSTTTDPVLIQEESTGVISRDALVDDLSIDVTGNTGTSVGSIFQVGNNIPEVKITNCEIRNHAYNENLIDVEAWGGSGTPGTCIITGNSFYDDNGDANNEDIKRWAIDTRRKKTIISENDILVDVTSGTGNRSGIILGATDCTCTGNQLEINSQATAIAVDGGSDRAKVQNNNATVAGFVHGINSTSGTSDVIVTGNYFGTTNTSNATKTNWIEQNNIGY